MTKGKRRPNYYPNRHNQWIIAGKIAVKTHAIDHLIMTDGKMVDMFCRNGIPFYSLIGQEYLRYIKININELT